jgi:hypothetical protein
MFVISFHILFIEYKLLMNRMIVSALSFLKVGALRTIPAWFRFEGIFHM